MGAATAELGPVLVADDAEGAEDAAGVGHRDESRVLRSNCRRDAFVRCCFRGFRYAIPRG